MEIFITQTPHLELQMPILKPFQTNPFLLKVFVQQDHQSAKANFWLSFDLNS